MRAIFRLIIIIFLFETLQAEEVKLSLPDKFDVKVSKHWWTENGNKPTENDAIREFNRPYIFNFNKNNFTFSDKKHIYSGGEWGSHYQATEGKGTINNNILKGNFITTGFSYTQNNLLHFLWTSKEKISGKVKENGATYLIGKNIIVINCKMRENNGEGWSNLNACDSTTLASLTNFLNKVKAHYILQLPINQSQSSQKFIADPKAEAEEPTQPIQEEPITIPKTNLSVNLSANKEIQEEPQKETNPCKDPDFKNDPEWQKYCANNAKLKVQNKILDEKEDKKIDKELKAQDAKDRRIEALEKEKAKQREKAQEAQEKQREKWREDNKQHDQAFRDKLAKDMQKRKEFNEQEQKNLALVSRSAKDTDTWKQEYHRIKRSKERYGSNLEKAKKLNVELQAHAIVNRSGSNEADKWFANKKISELSENADMEQAKKIKGAIKKQFHDSKQIRLQGEAEYMTTLADGFDKSAKKAELIRDTAITVNKILALPVIAQAAVGTAVLEGAVSEKMVTTVIPFAHGAATNAIGAADKDGVTGAMVSLAKDTADEFTFKFGGGVVDKGVRIGKFYYGDGIEVPPKMKVYDKNHKLFKKIKKGDKVYDDKGNNITYATTMRLMRYKWFVEQAQKDLSTGDTNKKTNAVLDSSAVGADGAEKILDIGKRLMK